jgi:hypothetical protein
LCPRRLDPRVTIQRWNAPLSVRGRKDASPEPLPVIVTALFSVLTRERRVSARKPGFPCGRRRSTQRGAGPRFHSVPTPRAPASTGRAITCCPSISEASPTARRSSPWRVRSLRCRRWRASRSGPTRARGWCRLAVEADVRIQGGAQDHGPAPVTRSMPEQFAQVAVRIGHDASFPSHSNGSREAGGRLALPASAPRRPARGPESRVAAGQREAPRSALDAGRQGAKRGSRTRRRRSRRERVRAPARAGLAWPRPERSEGQRAATERRSGPEARSLLTPWHAPLRKPLEGFPAPTTGRPSVASSSLS